MKTKKQKILAFPREIKIACLKDAVKDGAFELFFALRKILLDAPISKGGVEFVVIEKIRKEDWSGK